MKNRYVADFRGPTTMASSSPSRKVPSLSPGVASEMVGPSLPPDLILNILSRLPVKALGKFKSVSHQWLNLITDPYFIRTHRNRSLQNPNLLLLRKISNDDETRNAQIRKTQVDIVAFSFDGKHNFEFKIEVNGDIKLLPSKWDLLCFAGENGFYVCSPSTQELVKLPEASNCTSCCIDAGMGYISSRNEYVLIHLFDRSLDICVDYDNGCEILRISDGCVNSCSWKVVDANCPYVVRGWGVLVENVFYWMIWEAYDAVGDDAIMSFDLEKEEFGTVSPPQGCFDPNSNWSVVELRGFLCLIDSESRPFTMNIWALKDYEDHGWVKEYCIDLSGFDNQLLKCIPLDQRGGEILMDVKQESLVYYNSDSKSFKRTDCSIAGGWNWLRIYTESFLSLGTR